MELYSRKKLVKKRTTLSGDKGEIWSVVHIKSKYGGDPIRVRWRNKFGGSTEIDYRSVEELEEDFEEKKKA